ncbi:hypothetical protein AURDEDRAFT_124173 [Auricularia subglabra TFB-10046 SS5]|nr:hypothetical protein AURDEDRAFT_124173 [Auricularia subglabra TFB-10046 SS5]
MQHTNRSRPWHLQQLPSASTILLLHGSTGREPTEQRRHSEREMLALLPRLQAVDPPPRHTAANAIYAAHAPSSAAATTVAMSANPSEDASEFAGFYTSNIGIDLAASPGELYACAMVEIIADQRSAPLPPGRSLQAASTCSWASPNCAGRPRAGDPRRALHPDGEIRARSGYSATKPLPAKKDKINPTPGNAQLDSYEDYLVAQFADPPGINDDGYNFETPGFDPTPFIEPVERGRPCSPLSLQHRMARPFAAV